MTILELISGSAGRPWAQTFFMDNGRYYKRVIRESAQGSTKTVWLCGGVEGQEPFVEISDLLSKELEDTYQAWLPKPSKEPKVSKVLKTSFGLLATLVFSCSLTFALFEPENVPLGTRGVLALLSSFCIGSTMSDLFND